MADARLRLRSSKELRTLFHGHARNKGIRTRHYNAALNEERDKRSAKRFARPTGRRRLCGAPAQRQRIFDAWYGA